MQHTCKIREGTFWGMAAEYRSPCSLNLVTNSFTQTTFPHDTLQGWVYVDIVMHSLNSSDFEEAL
jgi:hypothetical protein